MQNHHGTCSVVAEETQENRNVPWFETTEAALGVNLQTDQLRPHQRASGERDARSGAPAEAGFVLSTSIPAEPGHCGCRGRVHLPGDVAVQRLASVPGRLSRCLALIAGCSR